MVVFRQKQYSEEGKELFIQYLDSLEGIKTRIKNLHWAAPAKNIHTYLDDFLDVVSGFQDTVAETYMGILGQMGPLDVNGVPCQTSTAMDLIDHVYQVTQNFYEKLPGDIEFKGIVSETETFIKDCKKYKYLFGLCQDNVSN